MSPSILETTTTHEYEKLGQPEVLYEILVPVLRRHLSEKHVALLSQPEFTQHKKEWISVVDGTSVRLSDLSGKEREVAEEIYQELKSDVENLANMLEQNGTSNEKKIVKDLRNAMEIPNDKFVYIVTPNNGGPIQPVLVNWAYRLGKKPIVEVNGIPGSALNPKTGQNNSDQDPINMDTDINSDKPTESSDQTNSIDRKGHFSPLIWAILWTILLFVIGVSLYLLIEPCGLNFGRSFNFCPITNEQMHNTDVRRQSLSAEIVQLERDIAIFEKNCKPNSSINFNDFKDNDTRQGLKNNKNNSQSNEKSLEKTEVIDGSSNGGSSNDDSTNSGSLNENDRKPSDNRADDDEPDKPVAGPRDESQSDPEASNDAGISKKNDNGLESEDENHVNNNTKQAVGEGDDESRPAEKDKNGEEQTSIGESGTTPNDTNLNGKNKNGSEIQDWDGNNRGIEIDNFELERRREREGAKSGELTLNLVWNTKSDLDLSVKCPSDSIISYHNAGSFVEGCNGKLDVDANYLESDATNDPIENIFF